MSKTFSMFLYFDGECREAAAFYAKAFQSEVQGLMTYGKMPPDPNNPVSKPDKKKVMYAGVQYGSITIMFCDMPADEEYIKGNNINPTIGTDSKDEISRIFNDLKEGAEIYMEPGQTFFSDYYCMVKDKYGVIWQLFLNEEVQ